MHILCTLFVGQHATLKLGELLDRAMKKNRPEYNEHAEINLLIKTREIKTSTPLNNVISNNVKSKMCK